MPRQTQSYEDNENYLLLSKVSHEIRNPVALINSFLQLLAVNHPELKDDNCFLKIEENMDFASSFCKERIPQIQARKPEGTYLMWLDCRGLGLSGSELNRFMVEQAKVGFGEGIWFGPEGAGFERCTAACPRPILQRGLEQIESAVKKLGK